MRRLLPLLAAVLLLACGVTNPVEVDAGASLCVLDQAQLDGCQLQ
jgi:hypothetical protein